MGLRSEVNMVISGGRVNVRPERYIVLGNGTVMFGKGNGNGCGSKM